MLLLILQLTAPGALIRPWTEVVAAATHAPIEPSAEVVAALAEELTAKWDCEDEPPAEPDFPEGAAMIGGRALDRAMPHVNPRVWKPP